MARILVLTPTTTPETGWGRYSAGVLSALREKGRYDIVPWNGLGEPVNFTELQRPMNVARIIRKAMQLRHKINEVKPAAVLSLISHPYAATVYLATLGGRRVPYFICCHGTYAVEPLYQNVTRQLSLRAFRGAERLFPVSSFTANKMQEGAAAIQNSTIAKNGLQKDSFRQAEPFDLDHETILTVGPFKPRKGQRLGVESFARIAAQFPDTDYHFVGKVGGDYYELVKKIVEEEGICDRVHFEGFVTAAELQRWYATADIYLFPAQCHSTYYFEGFGLVILEANWYGTPAIGTTESGAIDAISDGETGLLVTADAKNISDALAQLLTDDSLCAQFSENATQWAKQHTWQKTVDIISREIDQVVTNSP